MNSKKLLKKTGYQAILLFIFYCIVLFFAYSGYYFADQFPISGDGIQAFSNFELSKTMMENGELPLWNKWLAAGIPITNAFTPVLLFSILPAKEMYYAIYIVPLALGAVFTFLYLKEIKCKTWASVAISICYLLSIHIGGVRKSHVFIVLAIVVFPSILYFIERYFTTRQIRYLLLSSACMAVQLYAGGIQYSVYTDIFLFVYLLVFGVHYRIELKTMILHGAAWGFSYLGLIALYLAPQLEQLRTYSNVGAVRSAYETFVSYSIHPIKLIEMIFPKAFGADNYRQAFGPYFSSEVDIEIFLGVGIFALILSGIILLIRDFRVRFSFIAMVCVFIYGAMGAFPPLAKIVYQIPYLGDFRCPARDLFIFIFLAFTVAAMMLSRLDERRHQVAFLKITGGLTVLCVAVIGIAAVTIFIYTGITSGFVASNLTPLNDYLKNCLLGDLLWMMATLIVIALIIKYYQKLKSAAYIVLCAVIALTVIMQTCPYTLQTEPSGVSAVYASDETSILLKEEIGNYKIWDAFQGINPLNNRMISLNRAMTKEMASINAYTAFNNPNLYRLFTQEKLVPMNFSGLLTGSVKAAQNLYHQNSLLSMLGVKYIIDSSQILEKQLPVFQLSGEDSAIEYQAEQVTVPNSKGELEVIQDVFRPVEQSVYRISFHCDAQEQQVITVDFYGGPEYDRAAQEVTFTIQEGSHDYSGYIMSEDSNLYSDIYWRLLAKTTEEFALENFTITRMDCSTLENVYTLWNPEVDSTIYVNHNARDVLYVPDRIEQIDDKELLYQDTPLYDLDSVNYMEDMQNKILNPSAVTLENIDFQYNYIIANIETAEDTFVNFSQCYYPGWKAYVDGVETELYEVNGLIMGMEVPAGNHEIRFVYEPVVIWVGLVISIGTIIIMIAPYIYQYWKTKRRNNR